MAVGNTIFEALGFSYLGPIDGHDLNQLLPIFRPFKKIRWSHFIACGDQKGKGYVPAEKAKDKGHATGKFDVLTGKQTQKSLMPLLIRKFSLIVY